MLDNDRAIRYSAQIVPILPDLESEYLKRQLIAYIGNKRALLPFLKQPFIRLQGTTDRAGRFLDPFAGSGAVARLARSLGFSVYANDWEPYAAVLNRAFLTLTPQSAEALFVPRGGLAATLETLNQCRQPREEYFARWYAPANTQQADWRTERLFYTRENALFLDAVRERLDDWYPTPPGFTDAPEKTLLLALLMYEASVHSNTSGVFKAFHKGFGGHGGDALTRILAPMALEYPVLCASSQPAEVTSQDAVSFVRGRSAEICYLDPPYNQHQYGSNYHLLNTVARGDRPIPERKAGIRRDWTETKSPFCGRATAGAAFEALLDSIDARTIVLSYNTEGLVPFEQLYALLDRRGQVELAVQDYVTYRGGRQSPERRAHNLEFVLVVKTDRPAGSGQRLAVERFLAEKRLNTLLKGAFHPQRLRAAFPGQGTVLQIGTCALETDALYRVTGTPEWSQLSVAQLADIADRFAQAACQSHQEEAAVLLRLLQSPTPAQKRRERRLLLVLRKFAFAKYAAEIQAALEVLRAYVQQAPSPILMAGLHDLEAIVEKRLAGAQDRRAWSFVRKSPSSC